MSTDEINYIRTIAVASSQLQRVLITRPVDPEVLFQLRKLTTLLVSVVGCEQLDASPAEGALQVAYKYGCIEGAHHKAWVIDQMVRALTGPDYKSWVANTCREDDDPEAYHWDKGIAP